MAKLIPQRPLPDFLTGLALDDSAAEARLRRLLSPASRVHIDRILNRIRTGNDCDRRGALFELKTLDELRDEILKELVIESAPSCLLGKHVDFFVPSVGLGIELTASNRDAIPAAEVVGGEDRETIRRRINAAGCAYSTCGFADTLAGHLSILVQEKCKWKGFERLDFPVVLLLDGFFNDLHENYAGTPETEWVASYRREFARATYPKQVVVAAKRFQRSAGRSEVMGFPRTEAERGWVQRFSALFAPGRLYLRVSTPKCPAEVAVTA